MGGAALIAACWLSAGRLPFTQAADGMRAPADFARDYVAARARIENGRGAPPSSEDGNVLAARWGVPQVSLLGAPYFIHPPTTTLVTLGFAALPWPVAARLWTAAGAFALVWLAASLLAIARLTDTRRLAIAAALLVLWPPVLYCLEKGQWSLWLAALVAAGFRSLERGQSRRAGVLFGLAAALKLTPLVMLGLFLWRERRAAAAMATTIATAALAAAIVIGPASWVAFAAGASGNARAWAPWIANTASLAGVYARLTARSPFAQPLLVAPALGSTLFTLTVLGLLASAAWSTATAGPDPRARGRRTALWMTLSVVANPLGWSHALVMLLPSLAVLWREHERRHRWTALLILAAFTVPRQRLAAWAGTPATPAAGLWLGLHALAAIALFAALSSTADPTSGLRRDSP